MSQSVNTVEYNEDELFRFVEEEDMKASEKIIAPRYSYWRSVFRVFFKKKINIAMIIFLVMIVLVSFIMPIFWPYDPFENVTNASSFNLKPSAAMEMFGG